MIAALPMYDRPETAAANDRLWHLIRAALGDGPEELTRPEDLWATWLAPDLLLAQTCGYPYRARLHDKVKLVATPVWDLPDCAPGLYHSVIITRLGVMSPQELSGAVFAYNEALSQSGWAAAYGWALSQGIGFGERQATGAHRLSALAVAEGRADWAAIDVVTWEMMRRYDRFTDGLMVLDRTLPTPALPYITAISQDADRLRAALEQAIASLNPMDRDTLLLKDVAQISETDYRAVASPPPPT